MTIYVMLGVSQEKTRRAEDRTWAYNASADVGTSSGVLRAGTIQLFHRLLLSSLLAWLMLQPG